MEKETYLVLEKEDTVIKHFETNISYLRRMYEGTGAKIFKFISECKVKQKVFSIPEGECLDKLLEENK